MMRILTKRGDKEPQLFSYVRLSDGLHDRISCNMISSARAGSVATDEGRQVLLQGSSALTAPRTLQATKD